jgi:hypothetical protein
VLNGGLVWPKWHVLVPLHDRRRRDRLAAVLDAIRAPSPRPASTRASAVRSRHGLVRVPAAPRGRPGDIVVTPTAPTAPPTIASCARSRRASVAKHGCCAAQLQYPAAHLELEAVPTPSAHLLLVLVLLLACGAAAGVLVRRSYRRRRGLPGRRTVASSSA